MDPVYRIIDANCNRVMEALRTAEEYARFMRDNPGLSARLKNMRHACLAVAKEMEKHIPGGLLGHRDTPGDVGTGLYNPTARPDARSVAQAALKRAAEGLRVLAEYSRTFSVSAEQFERLRYQVYEIEPLLLSDGDRRERLAKSRLMVLITANLCSTDPVTACREAVAGGADVIQMREKEMEDGAFLDLAYKLADVCRSGGALFLTNDRPHIAMLVDADGVHTGQGDLPPHPARRLLGPDRLIGKSTSGPEFAEKALHDGIDYIGAGPVYETNTKQHRRAVGLEYVEWVSKWDRLPYFCIGSVNRLTVDAVIGAGARRLAICTAVTKASDIAAETRFFKEKLAVS